MCPGTEGESDWKSQVFCWSKGFLFLAEEVGGGGSAIDFLNTISDPTQGALGF